MIAKSHESQATTLGKETYDLVKGDFSPAEASEIVNDLFCKKINFHSLKSFQQLVRSGSKDHGSEQRINELKLAQKQTKELIQEAKESGKGVRVISTISIELI